jgi:Tol biopolymer transport system component
MSLVSGTRIGPYEIIGPIGAGGMGEVYRAMDTNLGRAVAIKTVPEIFAGDPDRLARFEREAKTLAALNHPHIAQIYGVEKRASGAVGAHTVLVMEYVEGEDLSRAMSRGPLPPETVIGIARQIAGALEAAHEQGIVHRDLKPANLKLRPDGTVKVLDFGLAKVLDANSGSSVAALDSSPTLTAQGTELGVVLGTAAYMAPEQARGRPLDKRADIWSFGVIVFEMLSGGRLFRGESSTEVLASVLTQPVPWELLPSTTPPSLRALLRRCLEADPRERLRDIGEARITLDRREDMAAVVSAAPQNVGRSAWLPWTIAAIAATIAIAAVAGGWRLRRSPATMGPLRFAIDVPQSFGLTRPGVNPVLSVSFDGRHVAFAAERAIWVWSAETGKVQRLRDTAGGRAPFFSPDGRDVGFFTADELRRVPVDGGPASSIAAVPGGGAAAWAADGTIFYQPWLGTDPGLWRVSAQGGTPHLLRPSAKQSARLSVFPTLLPDGRHYLFVTPDLHVNSRKICVAPIEAGDADCFARADSQVAYSPTGHILFVRRGQLMALPFDANQLRPTGEAFPVDAMIRWFGPTGIASFAVSGDGRTLVYHPPVSGSRLVWVGRKTRALTPMGQPARFGSVLLSRDETKVATEIWNDQTDGRDLYIVDVASGVPTRVTQEDIDAIMGAWLPDGRLVFSRAMSSPPDILTMSLDRPDDAKPLLQAPGVQLARDASRDGKQIAYVDQFVEREERVQVRLLSPDGQSRKFRDERGDTFDPRFSPDGRWLAYASIESDRPEIYVAPADGSGTPRRLSRSGGVLPRWRGDGRELFFVQGDGMIVAVDPSTTLPVPTLLFHVDGAEPNLTDYRDSERWFDYDVTRDGQRFLIRQPLPDAEPRANLQVVVGWLPAR